MWYLPPNSTTGDPVRHPPAHESEEGGELLPFVSQVGNGDSHYDSVPILGDTCERLNIYIIKRDS